MTPFAPHTGPLPRYALAIVAALAVFTLGFTWLLWPEWKSNPDLSHAFFGPFLFGLLLWESRRQGPFRWITPSAGSTFTVAAALGAGVVLFGLAGIFAATLAWTHAVVCALLAASLVAFLLAGLFILGDVRLRLIPVNWMTVVGIFLWLLLAPVPDGTYARLTLGLQQWVAGSVLQSLHLLGIPARQHGNIIELANATVGIEEACSGIRSLLSCIFAGFFFSAWLVRRPFGRAILILVAPLLALVMNFLRSLTLTLLANAGKDISGFWHDATGFAILGVTAAALAGLAILLETRETEPASPSSPPPTGTPVWSVRFFWIAALAMCLLGTFYVLSARRSTAIDHAPPDLARLLPAHAEGWDVLTPNDLYQFADVLQTNHLMERTYVRANFSGQITQLTVYVAYWAPGQTSVSRVASHTPDACWPGAGWTSQPVENRHEIPAIPGIQISPGEHRVFMNERGVLQNVWFWHIYNGRVISYRDPYSIPALFHIALEYGFRRPGEQYFVRISSNKPWADIQDEPLVREILKNLNQVGL